MKKLLLTLLSVMMICGLVTTNVFAETLTSINVTADFSKVDINSIETLLVKPISSVTDNGRKNQVRISLYSISGTEWTTKYQCDYYFDGSDLTYKWYEGEINSGGKEIEEPSELSDINYIEYGFCLYCNDSDTFDTTSTVIKINGEVVPSNWLDDDQTSMIQAIDVDHVYFYYYIDLATSGDGNSQDINVSFTLEEEEPTVNFTFTIDDSDWEFVKWEEGYFNPDGTDKTISISDVVGLGPSQEVAVSVSSKNSFRIYGETNKTEYISYGLYPYSGDKIASNDEIILEYRGDILSELGVSKTFYISLDNNDLSGYSAQKYSDVLTFSASVIDIVR